LCQFRKLAGRLKPRDSGVWFDSRHTMPNATTSATASTGKNFPWRHAASAVKGADEKVANPERPSPAAKSVWGAGGGNAAKKLFQSAPPKSLELSARAAEFKPAMPVLPADETVVLSAKAAEFVPAVVSTPPIAPSMMPAFPWRSDGVFLNLDDYSDDSSSDSETEVLPTRGIPCKEVSEVAPGNVVEAVVKAVEPAAEPTPTCEQEAYPSLPGARTGTGSERVLPPWKRSSVASTPTAAVEAVPAALKHPSQSVPTALPLEVAADITAAGETEQRRLPPWKRLSVTSPQAAELSKEVDTRSSVPPAVALQVVTEIEDAKLGGFFSKTKSSKKGWNAKQARQPSATQELSEKAAPVFNSDEDANPVLRKSEDAKVKVKEVSAGKAASVEVEEVDTVSSETEPEAEASAAEEETSSHHEDDGASFDIATLMRWRASVSNDDCDGDVVYIAAEVAEEPKVSRASRGGQGRLSSASSLCATLRELRPASRAVRHDGDDVETTVTTVTTTVRTTTTVRSDSTLSDWRSRASGGGSTSTAAPAKLEESPTSWAAQLRARRAAASPATGDDDVADAEVVRAVKCLLNKLTVEKFAQISKQLLEIKFTKARHVELLIKEVFEKATGQHHFIEMYADLCENFNTFFTENPISKDKNKGFKRLLLNECQNSFERNLQPPKDLDKLDFEERTIVEQKYKTRMIGNIRFVGALLARRMLASKVLIAILDELLGDPTAEALETCAALLTVTGPAFDTAEWSHRAAFDTVFSRVKAIVDKKTCPPRVRCILQDVLDLRLHGWKDRKPKKIEGPKTLAAVADQKAREEDTSKASTGTRPAADVDGWNEVGSNKKQQSVIARFG